MNAIIIDDDLIFCGYFQEVVSRCALQSGFILHTDIASSVEEVLYTQKRYDIFFIDIEMPASSGFDIVQKLRQLQVTAEFIFVSAYDSYMHSAFFIKPSAFIRKANFLDDVKDTIRYLKTIEQQQKTTVFLNDMSKQIEVCPANILYCQSKEHYVYLFFEQDSPKMIRASLNAVEKELSGYEFIRIHNRYLVNLNQAAELKSTELVLKNKKSLPVSRRFQKEIHITMMNWFAKRMDQINTDASITDR